MNWKTWLHSIVAAAIGGASNAALGAAAMPDTFNFTHQGWINLGKLALMGALVPVLTLLKQSPLPDAGKTGAILLALILSPALYAQTPAPAPAGFVASSDALAINVNGSWGVGNMTTEAYDFLDYGPAKSNHIFIQGVQLSAPSASFSVFGGGLVWQPDLSSLLKKTNLSAGNFVAFFDASAGNGIPATGTDRVSAIVGGGVKYILSDNITWNSVRFEEVFFGAQRYPAISTGLSAYFGGTPASAVASPTVRASLAKSMAKAQAQIK